MGADNIVEYQVAITKSGTGAADAANDLTHLHASATAAGLGIAAAAEVGVQSMHRMAGASYYARGAIDAVRFAAADGGMRAAFYALDETLRGLMSSGMITASVFSALAIPLAAVVAGTWTSVDAWKAYKAAQEAAADNLAFLQQTDLLSVRLSGVVDHLTAIGQMTPEVAKKIQEMVSQTNPHAADAYNFVPGIFGGNAVATGSRPDQMIPDAQKVALAGEMIQGMAASMKITADEAERLNEQLTTASNKTAGDVAGSITTYLTGLEKNQAAMEAWDKLQGKIIAEGLTGIDKERAQIAIAAAEMNKAIDAAAAKSGGRVSNSQIASAHQSVAENADAADAAAVEANGLKEVNAEIQQEIQFYGELTSAISKEIQESKQRAAAEQQLGDLQARLTEQTLTGTQREDAAIDARYADEQAKISELALKLNLTAAQQQTLSNQALAGWQAQRAAVDTLAGRINASLQTTQDIELTIAHSFASGMTSAFQAFIGGTESADQAFGKFAAQMMEQVAAMILEMEILKAIMGALGGLATGSSGGDFTGGGLSDVRADALGGVHFAADGIQAVSSPTYFPRFNVLAGEAGTEMLTVLAKPTMRSIGGMDAVVGNAGSRRLAITNANDLENRGAGGGASGLIHIQIDHTPETQATIIQNSIKGATTEVTRQLKRNSPMSAAVKQLTA